MGRKTYFNLINSLYTGCSHFIVFCCQDELPIILEVNAVPAIGPGSLVARQVRAGLSIQWQRSVPKFYTRYRVTEDTTFLVLMFSFFSLAEHSIKMFPVIQTKKKPAGGARGM